MMKDGRLALMYGFRSEPYGMRARLSNDKGQTWSDEIVLRNDAGCWDLGYPRSVQRPDGKIVTVYYYNDDPKPGALYRCDYMEPACFNFTEHAFDSALELSKP